MGRQTSEIGAWRGVAGRGEQGTPEKGLASGRGAGVGDGTRAAGSSAAGADGQRSRRVAGTRARRRSCCRSRRRREDHGRARGHCLAAGRTWCCGGRQRQRWLANLELRARRRSGGAGAVHEMVRGRGLVLRDPWQHRTGSCDAAMAARCRGAPGEARSSLAAWRGLGAGAPPLARGRREEREMRGGRARGTGSCRCERVRERRRKRSSGKRDGHRGGIEGDGERDRGDKDGIRSERSTPVSLAAREGKQRKGAIGLGFGGDRPGLGGGCRLGLGPSQRRKKNRRPSRLD